jgi:hypothetical protein
MGEKLPVLTAHSENLGQEQGLNFLEVGGKKFVKRFSGRRKSEIEFKEKLWEDLRGRNWI